MLFERVLERCGGDESLAKDLLQETYMRALQALAKESSPQTEPAMPIDEWFRRLADKVVREFDLGQERRQRRAMFVDIDDPKVSDEVAARLLAEEVRHKPRCLVLADYREAFALLAKEDRQAVRERGVRYRQRRAGRKNSARVLSQFMKKGPA